MTKDEIVTALTKQYEAILPILEDKILAKQTYSKAIQKASESYRVSDERKKHMQALKIS